ncbi:MAG: homoserine O-succinyltransferase [Alphaproteobacteria bacterium]|nr:homoserine O-succinyltransferase [Alphaproteobacteria bacterium]
MPVIVASSEIHPFLPSLGGPSAIEQSRALQQDIRPLEIAILNLMADKQATERQLALWLGNTALQVRLTFAATDNYVQKVLNGHPTKNTPAEHILKFYNAWSDIKHRKFDGLIVTGVNALEPRVEDEVIWPDVRKILDWSTSNVFSSLFLCWGAKAALKHFHDIDSRRGAAKTFGLFDHRLVADTTHILFGFPDIFPVPVSRWKGPRREDIAARPNLEIAADSAEAGPNILVEPLSYDKGLARYPHRVYVLNHPEYETETLKSEYVRDRASDPSAPLPHHYFPGDNASCEPINSWRHTGQLYTNWIKTIYEATPYDLAKVPQACR